MGARYFSPGTAVSFSVCLIDSPNNERGVRANLCLGALLRGSRHQR